MTRSQPEEGGPSGSAPDIQRRMDYKSLTRPTGRYRKEIPAQAAGLQPCPGIEPERRFPTSSPMRFARVPIGAHTLLTAKKRGRARRSWEGWHRSRSQCDTVRTECITPDKHPYSDERRRVRQGSRCVFSGWRIRTGPPLFYVLKRQIRGNRRE